MRIWLEEGSNDSGKRGENFLSIVLAFEGPILRGNGITSKVVSLCLSLYNKFSLSIIRGNAR